MKLNLNETAESKAQLKSEILSEANDEEIETDSSTDIAENLSIKPIQDSPSTEHNSDAPTPNLPSGQSLMEFSLAMLFQQTNQLLKVGFVESMENF